MSTLVANSIALPLDAQQLGELQRAVAGLAPAQLTWVSGYVAGLAAADGGRTAPAAPPGETLTVLYGSQTGNGQTIAERLAERARDQGYATNLVSLADYKPANLKRETLLTLVVSTHGEGDPPDDAELFHEFVLSDRAPKLAKLRYAVLALGDSSYSNFCQTGRDFDTRLAELGGERVQPLVECDLDYEDAAAAWAENVLAELPELLKPAESPLPRLRAVKNVATFDKSNPFPAEVLANQKITAADSSKDVRHIELSLEGSGLRYEPGDSLAVIVHNPPQLVSEFLNELGLDAEEAVTVGSESLPLRQALDEKLEITAANQGFLRAWAGFSGANELSKLVEPGNNAALARFLETHQIIDVVRKYSARISAETFVGSLRKLSPRSYSIASSLAANPDDVHLTVAAVRYEAFGRPHWGAASTHLADRVAEGDSVRVFVEPNPRFRLPSDDTPIIMIGPGTGVAPFRAFIEERVERGATGRNWLFFGDRTFRNDFLYQLEWLRHRKNGHLDRLDVAFSRDRGSKVYVQHRLRENARDIYGWLDEGAVIYVCGDAKHMAGDVHDALIEIIAAQAGRNRDDAERRLKELRRAGRYQRDVY